MFRFPTFANSGSGRVSFHFIFLILLRVYRFCFLVFILLVYVSKNVLLATMFSEVACPICIFLLLLICFSSNHWLPFCPALLPCFGNKIFTDRTPTVLELNTILLNCFFFSSSEKCFTTVYFVLIRTILIPVVVWFERAGFV